MSAIVKVTRREFLKLGGAAGAGLVLGLYLPFGENGSASAVAADRFAPNVWLQIDAEGTVTIWVHRSEMGQGVRTSLPMIVADELEADWSRVRVVQADADERYGSQFTTGSRSVHNSFEPLRRAGAAGREMLIAVAAGAWAVARESCRAENGEVVHGPTGRRMAYGDLVDAASELEVPENPPLKDPRSFHFIGKRIPRTDTPLKVDGSAVFGLDVRVPGMLHAVVARPTVFGGTVKRFDAGGAKSVDGVRDVVQIDSGVAVIAESTWAAMKGERALEVDWDEGELADLSSEKIAAMFADGADSEESEVKTSRGDVDAALKESARTLEAVYEVPYLAHACMEPMNCTADVRDDRCEIWAPTQTPQRLQQMAAEVTGLPVESVTVHVTFMGGGFGRRGTDFGREAVQASKAVGAPVQVVWRREDDTRGAHYRPATYNTLSAALDSGGRPVAWRHRIVAPEGGDWIIVGGAANLPYAIPNIHVDHVVRDPGILIWAWRSVAHSQSAFVTESFIDELADAAGRDPYEYRRELIADSPAHRRVLDVAAEKAGWRESLPEGRGRGIAVEALFGTTYAAQVAEVSVDADGNVRVHRVVCAVDGGLIVNPDTAEAQIESAIVYGLTAALKGEITIEDGRVQQSNFHNYPMLRMNEMPVVEVHILDSDREPMGMGEAGTPPIAPAVANAIFAATGTRIRSLPIKAEMLRQA